jgi:hypothetical protein
VGFESLSFSWKFSNRIIEVITQLNKLFLKIISFSLQAIDYDLDVLIASIVIIEFPTDGFYLTVNSLYLFFAQWNLPFYIVHDGEFVLEARWKILAVLNTALSLRLI